MISNALPAAFTQNSLITAFAFVGVLVWVSYRISASLTRGHIHGSAIAIAIGLVLAYVGGAVTGGSKGLADIELFAGVGIMGGAMFRDFAIVATAFGADIRVLKKAGLVGGLSVLIGVVLSFVVGTVVALIFGYTDAVSISTIGAGAATYIVGPVTGTALGAGSEIIALSVAAGLTKAVLVMIGTPLVASRIGLDNPQSALIYGGLMGTTSGVAGGLAATDPKLVPYGAMTATFYTGLGCLLCPSLLYLIVRALTSPGLGTRFTGHRARIDLDGHSGDFQLAADAQELYGIMSAADSHRCPGAPMLDRIGASHLGLQDLQTRRWACSPGGPGYHDGPRRDSLDGYLGRRNFPL